MGSVNWVVFNGEQDAPNVNLVNRYACIFIPVALTERSYCRKRKNKIINYYIYDLCKLLVPKLFSLYPILCRRISLTNHANLAIIVSIYPNVIQAKLTSVSWPLCNISVNFADSRFSVNSSACIKSKALLLTLINTD